MSLSDHEQQALAGIELRLAADAPRLAAQLSTISRTRQRRLRRRTRALRLVVLAVGVAAYLGGLHLANGYGLAVALIGYFPGAVAIASALPRL